MSQQLKMVKTQPNHYRGTSHRSFQLVLSDVICFVVVVMVSMLVSVFVRWLLLGVVRYPTIEDSSRIITVFIPALGILLWNSWSHGHYNRFRPFWSELQDVFRTVLFIAVFDVFLLFIIGVQFSRLWFGFFLLALAVIVPYGRELTKMILIKKNSWYQTTYIIGTGSNAQKTARAIASDSSLGFHVAGFVELSSKINHSKYIDGVPVFTSIPTSVQDTHHSEKPYLLFAFESMDQIELHREFLNNHIATSTHVSVVPPSMGLPLFSASVTGIYRHDTALLEIQNNLNNRRSQLIKRSFDVIFGLFCLIVFLPVYLISSFIISRDGGPIFFRHKRIGKDGVEFFCLKFRTMTTDGDRVLEQHLQNNETGKYEWDTTRKLKNDPRVTPFGKYLRATSLDELPQLWNVIKGEMSLIGPRPIVQSEKRKYSDYLPYYLTMTPGMTGLWQVSGRTETTYDERIRLDVWYSRNWSLWNDVVILILTVKTLLRRHGAY